MLEGNNKFTDADSEKIVEFLNFISLEAKFDNMDVKKVIKFYGLLSWSQQVLASKIKANVLEIRGVHTPEPEPKSAKKKAIAKKVD